MESLRKAGELVEGNLDQLVASGVPPKWKSRFGVLNPGAGTLTLYPDRGSAGRKATGADVTEINLQSLKAVFPAGVHSFRITFKEADQHDVVFSIPGGTKDERDTWLNALAPLLPTRA
eukprot:TRINITY_DN460_c0_g1_i2.p1 TRINITY_DN460_c0_g1~~TRINITY_DN460_c0_g1_i2.p1  ORF type:complete len:118 (-),score=15.91 TRINITY_DN460_c0_g1_i2:41-394(-)